MKTIYSLMIAVMSVVMLTGCGASDEASCKDNPFGTACGADFADTRDEIITLCIKGDFADHAICASAVKANSCIENPFDVECETTFADYYETARENRASYCGGRFSTPSSICTSTTNIDVICNYAPFKHRCFEEDNPYESLRESRIILCEDSTNISNTFCKQSGLISRLCFNDPFSAVCFSESSETLNFEDARIHHCIIGGNASEENCKKVFAEDSCVRYPFVEGCDAPESLFFVQRVKTAKDNRINFCITAGNANHVLCNGLDALRSNCISNPFTASCIANNDFKGYILFAQNSRVDFCGDVANSENILCPQVFRNCLSNPFGQDCDMDMTFGNYANTVRFEFCGMAENISNTSCASILSKPTAASWLQSFDAGELASVALFSDAGNSFFQGIEAAESNIIDRTNLYTAFSFLDYYTLNLDDGDAFSNNNLGGDKEDGVAFFSRHDATGTKSSYYAGVFSSTDLGLPLTSETASGTWNGRFSAINRYSIGNFVNEPFILTVNFGAGSQAGTIAAQVLTSDNYTYALTGDFDNNGVIRGTSTFLGASGRLRGLIGQEGAVGVFVGNNDDKIGNSKYGGGFVARPPDE